MIGSYITYIWPAALDFTNTMQIACVGSCVLEAGPSKWLEGDNILVHPEESTNVEEANQETQKTPDVGS